jgi:hypothetical protein
MKGVSLLIRATCQGFRFKLPYSFERIKNVQITFWQEGNEGTDDCPLPITKVLADCTGEHDGKELSVVLNQVETAAFMTDRKAFVQFRGLTDNDFVFGSHIMPITVYPVKNDTVLE